MDYEALYEKIMLKIIMHLQTWQVSPLVLRLSKIAQYEKQVPKNHPKS